MPNLIDSEERFWKQPLGVWIKDCISGPDTLIPESTWRSPQRVGEELSFIELCDGFVFNILFVYVDSSSINVLMMRNMNLMMNDSSSRLKQFTLFMQSIQSFYRNRLDQLILMPLPDLLNIVRNPHPDGCMSEMNKVLLLLLGCAVQGEQREKFIDRIQNMQKDLQDAIVAHIKTVTEEGNYVLNIKALELNPGDENSAYVVAHLERIIKERDVFANSLFEIVSEHESDEGSTTTGASSLPGDISRSKFSDITYEGRVSSPTTLERHNNVEIASLRAENRKLRNLVEEKDETIAELKDDLEIRDGDLLKLQEERLELVKDARAAKDYMDELDCLQHKMNELEKMESENEKLKEKLVELEFFKSRLAQMKEENDLMHESCSVLEEQLEKHQRKANLQTDQEQKLSDYQNQLKNNVSQLAQERAKREELLIENGKLERDLEAERQKNCELLRKVELRNDVKLLFADDAENGQKFGSLASQIADDDRKRILELELENRKLRSKLDITGEKDDKKLEEPGTIQTKLLRIEIELSQRTEELAMANHQLHEFEITLSQLTQQYKQVCELCERLREERDDALQNLQEARKNFSEFQVDFHNEIKQDFEEKVNDLQVQLEHSEKRIETIQIEKLAVEKNIEVLDVKNKEDAKIMNQLQIDLKTMNDSLLSCSTQKNAIKTENEVLKSKLISLEGEFMELEEKLENMDNMEKKLINAEKSLSDKQIVLCDFDCEIRQLKQMLELETKKTDRFREDLIVEKSRCNDLVSRLRSVFTTIQTNGGKCEIPEEDEEIIANIDDIILKALVAAKREADALRIQQHSQMAELNDLKRDIEKLRRSENAALNESDDRVQQLTLENKNVKDQVFLLQSRIRDLQAENSANSGELNILKREIEEYQKQAHNLSKLHTELAKLQVSLRNLQLQEELLRKDNIELQKQLHFSEQQKRVTKSDSDALQSMHSALLTDHDRLQTLHDMLTNDYERLKQESCALKTKLRNKKSINDEIILLKSEKERDQKHIEELKVLLAEERSRRERETRFLNNELSAIRKEKAVYHEELYADELNKLRLSEQSQRSAIAHLDAKIADLNRVIHGKDMDITKLQNFVDMLTYAKTSLEQETEFIINELNYLNAQNDDLLSKIINETGCSQKDFQERIALLRLRKEALEAKVIELFQKICRNVKNSSFSSYVVRSTLSKTSMKTIDRITDRTSNGSATDSSLYSGEGRNDLTDNFLHGIFNESDNQACSSESGSNKEHHIPSPKPTFNSDSDHRILSRSINRCSTRSNTNCLVSEEGIDRISLCGSERAVDVSSPSHLLPPRPPTRPSPIGRATLIRPPPPPYNTNKTKQTGTNKPSPPPYPGWPQTPQDSSTSIKGQFVEAETREVVRTKEERTEKAMSLYENVNCDTRNGNTIWYEYGCV